MAVYKRLRELREDRDLTQIYIANMLHVNQKTYSRYETGEHAIPLEQLCKIADFYDCLLYTSWWECGVCKYATLFLCSYKT